MTSPSTVLIHGLWVLYCRGLSPRKLHPLLEAASAKNGSRKNYSVWTFAAHMNQTPQKKRFLRNLPLFLSFCLRK